MYIPKFKGKYRLDVYSDDFKMKKKLEKLGLIITIETVRSSVVFQTFFSADNEKDLLDKKHKYQQELGEEPSVVRKVRS